MSYVTQNTRGKPFGLTAAIAINGSIIAAIMLSPMVVPPQKARDPINIIQIDAKNPPPPPETKMADPIIPPIFVPDPIIKPLPPQTPPPTTTRDLPPVTDLPPLGTIGKEPVIAAAAADITKIIPEVAPPPIFKPAERDSRYSRNFQPEYPRGLLKQEIEGNVTIKVLIGTDGRVRQANVIRATHPDFGAATEKQALKSWRFKPATRDGKAVEDWQTLTVRFDIS